MKKRKYCLILNNSCNSIDFESIAALKRYAKEHELEIKHSYTDVYCWHTESYGYIPGR